MKYRRFLRNFAVVSSATVFAVSLSLAQTQGGGSSSGGGGGGGSRGGGATGGRGGGTPGTGTPDRTTPTQPRTPQEQMPRMPEMRRPIYLQGNVILDNGEPAPPNVVIERFCSGQSIPEDYTDSKGRFSFEVGRNTQFIADASTSAQSGNPMSNDPFGRGGGSTFGVPNSQGISERDLMGCELRAVLPGYRSTTIQLAGHRLFDNPNVGTIVLRKLGDVEGLTISMTSLEAPKTAKKAFDKGVKHAQKERWDKAVDEIRLAVEEYPEYAEAWFTLGQLYEAQQQPDSAREAYGKAVAADKKFVKPYLQLAHMDARASDWQAVAQTTDEILRLNPYDFPEAYFLSSVAHLNLNNHPEAEKSAREAIEMNHWRQRPQLEQILGLALAYQNNYGEAVDHLKKYLALAPDSQNAPQVQKQVAQLERFLAENVDAQQATAGQSSNPE